MTNILVGVALFAIIGVFHPVVIKAEYRYGYRCWPLFFAGGLVFMIAGAFIPDWKGIILEVLAFTLFWSIVELYHQAERVEKGWFPKGPGHIPWQRKKKQTDHTQNV